MYHSPLVRPKFILFMSQGGMMATWVFIPLVARGLGISDVTIGLVVGAYAFSNLISNYVFGWASDRIGRRPFLWGGLVLSGLALLGQVLVTDLWSLLIARVLVGLAAGIFAPALIAYVHDSNQVLGRFSAFGSLGWGILTLVAGFIADAGLVLGSLGGYDSVFIFSALCLFAAFAVSLGLPGVRSARVKGPLFPMRLIGKNLQIYLPLVIRHGAASSLWTFWALFLKVDLGAPDWMIGLTMFINAITQFLFMFLVSDRIRTYWLRAGGLLLTVITFLVFALAPNLWMVLCAQVLLGVSWASLYVGSLRYVTSRNREKATATGVLNSSLSFASLLGPVLATLVLFIVESSGSTGPISGYRMVIFVATLIQALGFLSMVILSPRPVVRH